jgi:TldD protein
LDVDVLRGFVESVSGPGFEYVEARFHSRGFTQLFFINGVLAGAHTGVDSGVSFRVLYNGGLGFSATSDVTRDGLRDALSRAVSSARASSLRVKSRISMSPARLGSTSYRVLEVRPLDGLSVEDKIREVQERVKGLDAPRDPVRLTSYTVVYNEVVERKLIVTSDGGLVESVIPRVSITYNLSATTGDRRANRWNMVAGSGGFELVERLRFDSEMRDDVESLYVNLVKAGSPPRGRMDVILSPEIVGLSVHESIGHPSEADRILGREAAQAGLSYRRDYKDPIIGSPHVTVYDDPTIPGSYGFYLYDDEGVPARRRVLIDRGRLAELLHNRETASAYGVESNASARATDYRSERFPANGISVSGVGPWCEIICFTHTSWAPVEPNATGLPSTG